jgi:ribonuclease P protein component
MRFRAEQHLRRPGDIRAVREQGRRIDCRAFTMWWKKREADVTSGTVLNSPPRVCVIASTKAVGAAVQRNRAKRRLREVFRRQQQHVPPGCDLLLIARDWANIRPLPEMETKFSDACRQIASALVAEKQ